MFGECRIKLTRVTSYSKYPPPISLMLFSKTYRHLIVLKENTIKYVNVHTDLMEYFLKLEYIDPEIFVTKFINT